MSGGRSLDQERAQHALAAIEGLKEGKAKYRQYVAALPAAILTNGFGQALASYMAGERSGQGNQGSYGALVGHLEGWMLAPATRLRVFGQHQPSPGQGRLIHHLVHADRDRYAYAQVEALAYLEWLKKLANALLDADASETPDGASGS